MTPDEIRSAIMSSIAASWATATEICYPNQHFVAPQASWIRPTIKMSETVVGELGDDGIGMRSGLLMISIFGLAGQGTKTLMGYASRLESLFRRRDVSGYYF